MSDQTNNPLPEDQGTPPPPPPPGGDYYQQAPPPPMQAPTGVGQPADLLQRFLARLIDFILLAVVNGIIVSAIVVGAFMGGSAAGFGSGFGMDSGITFEASAVSAILSTLISLAYFVLLESNRGQTLGKMLLKLETRGPGGGHPTVEEALKRNAFIAIGLLGIIPILGLVGSLLSLAAYIMIAVTINNNPTTRQGWHDNFAGGTSVIKVG